ncbi:MAG: hypothetical protein HFJ48_05175 [Clostridia bacterium]|nr:hypothetical protein [Clostridia bacterium]
MGNKVEKVVGKGLSTNDFTDAYKQKIDSMQRLYKFKGSISTYNDLNNIVEKTTGDVYNILDTNNNYCWDGIQWIELGIQIDLSEYQNQLEELETKQNEKIDKLQNDFKQQRYYLTLEEDLQDNSELVIPCLYKVRQ